PAEVRCSMVRCRAARHRPFAIAALPIANHGRTISRTTFGPSPGAEIRSPAATETFSIETGAESLPRSPSPLKDEVTRTPSVSLRMKYTVDSKGDVAFGFCAVET